MMDVNVEKMGTERTFVKVDALAKAIDVSLSTAHRWVARGEIPFSRFGRLIKIKQSDIEEFIKRSEVR